MAGTGGDFTETSVSSELVWKVLSVQLLARINLCDRGRVKRGRTSMAAVEAVRDKDERFGGE